MMTKHIVTHSVRFIDEEQPVRLPEKYVVDRSLLEAHPFYIIGRIVG